MKRRNFLKGLMTTVVITAVPVTLGKTIKRTIEIDTENGWQQIDMKYLKSGDVFRIRDNGKTVIPQARAAGNPFKTGDVWGISIFDKK